MEWNFQQGIDNLAFICGIYGVILISAATILLIAVIFKVTSLVFFKIKVNREIRKTEERRSYKLHRPIRKK